VDAARGGLTKLLSNAIRGRQAGFSETKNPRQALKIVCVNVCIHTCGELSVYIMLSQVAYMKYFHLFRKFGAFSPLIW